MASYYVNKNAQLNGDFVELAKDVAEKVLPSPLIVQRTLLGDA